LLVGDKTESATRVSAFDVVVEIEYLCGGFIMFGITHKLVPTPGPSLVTGRPSLDTGRPTLAVGKSVHTESLGLSLFSILSVDDFLTCKGNGLLKFASDDLESDVTNRTVGRALLSMLRSERDRSPNAFFGDGVRGFMME